MTPTVDHNPPAHHAIAIGIGSIIRATVCVVGSSAKAEPKRKSRRKAPAPTAAPPSAAMPATAVPTAPSCIGRRGKRRRDSDDCDGGCSAPRFLPDGPLDPERPATVQRPRDLKQVWFPGVHCDVGGGYPEPESGLSKIALRWMLKEAITAGLLVVPGAGSRARQERGLRRPRHACRDARFSDRALVVGRRSLEAALQLGQAKVGAPAQPGPAAHHPAKLAHPRIGLSTRWRLCEASAPDAIPTS